MSLLRGRHQRRRPRVVHVAGDMSEFIEAAERLADIRPGPSDLRFSPYSRARAEYELAERNRAPHRRLGLRVISGEDRA